MTDTKESSEGAKAADTTSPNTGKWGVLPAHSLGWTQAPSTREGTEGWEEMRTPLPWVLALNISFIVPSNCICTHPSSLGSFFSPPLSKEKVASAADMMQLRAWVGLKDHLLHILSHLTYLVPSLPPQTNFHSETFPSMCLYSQNVGSKTLLLILQC